MTENVRFLRFVTVCDIVGDMEKIKLRLAERSYEITVGSGVVSRLSRVIREADARGPVAVITDTKVKKRTGRIIDPLLEDLPAGSFCVTVPSSERSKSISVFQDTVRRICAGTRNHKPVIVALGGGVVGDLAGFVAATYRRGVPFIQVPTTLLAQVDSSVGGKVGIDLPEAKNLIGAFCQPQSVLMDTDFLHTLPARQIRNGMGEIIKYAVISDRVLFGFLEDKLDDILSLGKKPLEDVIARCVLIKARVVERDEFDVKDIRISLNFGHTLGHAIETASGYSGAYNHGESVALGMLLAGDIAVRLKMFAEKDLVRMRSLIKRAGLPVRAKGVSIGGILRAHEYDKKFVAGTNRFVLPVKIGAVTVVENVPAKVIRDVLRDNVG